MFCITLPPFSKLIFITVCLDCFKLYLKIDKFERDETLAKNGGESSHTLQLQEKIWETFIRFWRNVFRPTVLTCVLSNLPVMSQCVVVYRRLFQILALFPNRNYESRSTEYNFNCCWHHTLFLKRKSFLIFKIFSRHQEDFMEVSAAWRYRWLACALIALQVVRTSSPGSRPRQFFPPPPGLVPKSKSQC